LFVGVVHCFVMLVFFFGILLSSLMLFVLFFSCTNHNNTTTAAATATTQQQHSSSNNTTTTQPKQPEHNATTTQQQQNSSSKNNNTFLCLFAYLLLLLFPGFIKQLLEYEEQLVLEKTKNQKSFMAEYLRFQYHISKDKFSDEQILQSLKKCNYNAWQAFVILFESQKDKWQTKT